jgi:hypothetical protein
MLILMLILILISILIFRYYQAPLHLASFWGNIPMVRRLIDMGADIEVRSRWKF